MTLYVLGATSLLAALVSFALTPLSMKFAVRIGAVDEPSQRKVHAAPMPRLGGLAVIAASIIAVAVHLLFAPKSPTYLDGLTFWSALASGLVPIIAISLRDDVTPIGAGPKFVAQLAGAGTAMILGIRLTAEVHLFNQTIHIGWVAIPLSLFWLVGVTNAFNIVDGLDGLSGGLALISALSLGTVSVVARRPEMATASFILAGALIGFLPYNIYPARVFLGDTGATAVGFTLAALALRGGSTLSAGMAILVPVLVLGLPIAETLVSMARRAMRRLETKTTNGVFEADRNHFHHRLISLGLDHRQAVLVLYGAGLLFALCAVASIFITYRNAAILLVVFLSGAAIGLHKLGYDEFAVIRRGTMLKAYEAPVLHSRLFTVFVDVLMVIAALYVALVLKYDDLAVLRKRVLAVQMLPIAIGCCVLAFVVMRVYRTSWRLASVEDLIRPTAAIAMAAIASQIIYGELYGLFPPVSLQAIFAVVLVGMFNGSRASYRLLNQWSRRASAAGEPVLIYGAGATGQMAVHEALTKRELNLRPVGFIDDDETLQGRWVNGFPVVGTGTELTELLDKHAAAGVLIASGTLTPERASRVWQACIESGRWIRNFHVDIRPAIDRPIVTGVQNVPRIPVRMHSDPPRPRATPGSKAVAES